MSIKPVDHSEGLVLGFQNGDKNEFDFLFREYYSRLCFFAELIVKNHDDARDVVQECFVKLWNNSLTINNTEAIKSYLYTTVRNASLNFIRNKKTLDKYTSEAYEARDKADTNWLDKVTHAEMVSQVYNAITTLPPRMQEVFCKSIWEGKDCNEIANDLHTSPSTVRKQKARALILLKEKVRKIAFLLFFL
jgi:RNA polymerase sigma-70 factor (family 1)